MQPGFFTIAGKRLQIHAVIATFDVWPLDESLPFAFFSVRVVQRGAADYQASPNVSVRNVESGDVEYTCGLGASAGQAVQDALTQFLGEVEKQSRIRVLAESDFVWGTDLPVGLRKTFILRNCRMEHRVTIRGLPPHAHPRTSETLGTKAAV